MDDYLARVYGEYADKRPGLSLVSVEPAAVPVTILNTSVLAQERKALPLLDELVVRSVLAGLVAVGDIADLLGLTAEFVSNAVVDGASAGRLTYDPRSRTVALTPIGRQIASELASVTPVERDIKITFDRMTWQAAAYAREDLVTKGAAREEGRILLPAAQKRQLGPEDVTSGELNRLLRSAAPSRNERQLEVLRIIRARASSHQYLRCVLLIYSSKGDFSTPEVSVLINDRPSAGHDLALEGSGGAEALEIVLEQGADESPAAIEPGLERFRQPAGKLSSPVPDSASVEEGATDSAVPLVRGVTMFEHRLLLQEALESSKRRLLLISPWVKDAVVDTSFIAALERALRRGVIVDIAHGFGSNDDKSDERALRRLQNLQQRYKDKFTLTRHPNTHAKVLIYDDVWIATSFNWLSFRGDANRTYRMEEGTLVRSPSHVSAEYERYRDRLRHDS